MSEKPEKTKILGVSVTRNTKDEILEYIVKTLLNTSKKLSIFTPNPEMIVRANRDSSFKETLNSGDINLPDGVGLVYASLLLGTGLKERITGVDFVKKLCAESSKRAFTIGLLGGRNGVAEKASNCLRENYPGLKVVFIDEEWNKENFQAQLKAKKLDSLDILFVAYGVPKQEEWIHSHLPQLPIRVAMAVGGSLDFISKSVPRAPRLVQKVGFEWLFRLLIQPWRIKRQFALLHFTLLVLKERFQ